MAFCVKEEKTSLLADSRAPGHLSPNNPEAHSPGTMSYCVEINEACVLCRPVLYISKKRPGSCCTDKTMPVGTQLCLTQPSARSCAVTPLWLTLGFSALYLSRRAWMRAPYSGSTSEKFLTWSQRKTHISISTPIH